MNGWLTLTAGALGIVAGVFLSAYVRQLRNPPVTHSLADRLRWYTLR